MVVQDANRAIRRQGRRWEIMKSRQPVRNKKRKIVEDSGSLEKFVGGVISLRKAS